MSDSGGVERSGFFPGAEHLLGQMGVWMACRRVQAGTVSRDSRHWFERGLPLRGPLPTALAELDRRGWLAYADPDDGNVMRVSWSELGQREAAAVCPPERTPPPPLPAAPQVTIPDHRWVKIGLGDPVTHLGRQGHPQTVCNKDLPVGHVVTEGPGLHLCTRCLTLFGEAHETPTPLRWGS